jgi:hypothetical protein
MVMGIYRQEGDRKSGKHSSEGSISTIYRFCGSNFYHLDLMLVVGMVGNKQQMTSEEFENTVNSLRSGEQQCQQSQRLSQWGRT